MLVFFTLMNNEIVITIRLRNPMFIKRYSEFRCIMPTFIHSLSDVDNHRSKIWSASFKLDQDVCHLFPYINAVLDEAVYYEKPEHVRFLFEGYRCFLYPDSVAAHFFESKTAAKDFIACLIDFLNDIYNQKEDIRPNYNQIKQVPIIDILKILPKTNCQKCGYLTCMAFAAAITKGKVAADKCPSLVSPISENAVYPIFDNNGKLVSSFGGKGTGELSFPISLAVDKNGDEVFVLFDIFGQFPVEQLVVQADLRIQRHLR